MPHQNPPLRQLRLENEETPWKTHTITYIFGGRGDLPSTFAAFIVRKRCLHDPLFATRKREILTICLLPHNLAGISRTPSAKKPL